MAGYYSVQAKNLMLDALGAVAVKISAHTADPGATGTNECAGSTRGTVTWASASGGIKLASNTPLVTGIAITDSVAWLGLWNSAGTTYYGKMQVTATSASGGSTWDYQCGQNSLDLNAFASA